MKAIWEEVPKSMVNWFSTKLDASRQTAFLRAIYPHRPPGKLRDILGIPKGEKNFDIDICEADVEPKVKELLASQGTDKVEVKKDFKAAETGNVAVEFRCRGKPSGITTTEATDWCFVLAGKEYNEEVKVLIKIERLRRIVQTCQKRRGGDIGADGQGVAEIYLVPLGKLIGNLIKY